jgi:ABC-type nitrate/sulfonate/bicarbonate transport system substrate-binding protein
MKRMALSLAALAVLAVSVSAARAQNLPVFTLAWSEYPSWSVFGVASDRGLINGEKGKVGLLEKRWGVDIELQLLTYDKCIESYSAKTSDAACLTNMDSLAPSLARKTVAIMPTSTSVGADALIVVGIKDLDDLKKYEVHGLSQSVSDYALYRLLTKNGKNPKEYKWKDLDPAEAAKALVAKKAGGFAIMVWNPFVLQTLRDRKDSKILVDSAAIEEEIVDMVVVGDDVLNREKGKDFAGCVAQVFYEFNVELANASKRDKLLVDLGKRFSSLDAKDMAVCCEKTRFYKTPDLALELFAGKRTDQFKKTMETITADYLDRKIIKAAPKLGYGPREDNKDAQLIFDPTILKTVKEKLGD